MIKELAKEIHKNALAKGFWEQENTAEKIALMHSELSEALEADRKNLYFPKNLDECTINSVNGWREDEAFKSAFLHCVKDTFEDEMADTIIRIIDMCEYKGIDLEGHIKAKMRFNSLRPYKHGKKY